MVPEKLINEFVERIREAAGTNLVAAILYGSAAAGDYIADLLRCESAVRARRDFFRSRLKRWLRRWHGGGSRNIGCRC